MAGDDDFADPEMKDLPDDPTLAFVVYQQRLRASTRDVADRQEGWSLERRYANSLIAFIRIEGLPIPVENPPSADSNFGNWYYHFLTRIDYHLIEYKLAHARRRSTNVTAAISFSPDYKAEIGSLLDRIRKVVNQAELEDKKKDAIYAKIAALHWRLTAAVPFSEPCFLASWT